MVAAWREQRSKDLSIELEANFSPAFQVISFGSYKERKGKKDTHQLERPIASTTLSIRPRPFARIQALANPERCLGRCRTLSKSLQSSSEVRPTRLERPKVNHYRSKEGVCQKRIKNEISLRRPEKKRKVKRPELTSKKPPIYLDRPTPAQNNEVSHSHYSKNNPTDKDTTASSPKRPNPSLPPSCAPSSAPHLRPISPTRDVCPNRIPSGVHDPSPSIHCYRQLISRQSTLFHLKKETK